MKEMMKILKSIVIVVVGVATLLGVGFLWLAWDTGMFPDYGVESGYYGQFNRVKHTIEALPDLRIADHWMHKDISLEDFGFFLVDGGSLTTRVDFTEGSPQMAEKSKKWIEQFIRTQIASNQAAQATAPAAADPGR